MSTIAKYTNVSSTIDITQSISMTVNASTALSGTSLAVIVPESSYVIGQFTFNGTTAISQYLFAAIAIGDNFLDMAGEYSLFWSGHPVALTMPVTFCNVYTGSSTSFVARINASTNTGSAALTGTLRFTGTVYKTEST